MGVFYLFSLGGFGLGWLVDGCRFSKLVRRAKSKQRTGYQGAPRDDVCVEMHVMHTDTAS